MRNTLVWGLDVVCWLGVLVWQANWLRRHSQEAPGTGTTAWPALTAGVIAGALALGQLLLSLQLWLTTPRALASAAFLPGSPLALAGTLASWVAALLAVLLTLAATRAILRWTAHWPSPLRTTSALLVTWGVSTVALVVGLGLVLAAHLALAARDYGKLVPVTVDGNARLHFVHAPERPALDYGERLAETWRGVGVAAESLAPADGDAAGDVAARLSAQTPLLRLRPLRSDDALIDACAPASDPACMGERYVAEIASPWPYIAHTPLAFARECIRTMRGTLLGLPRSLLRRDLDNAGRFFALDAEAAAHYVDRPSDATVQTLIHRANPRRGHALNLFPALLAALWLPALLTLMLLRPARARASV